MGASGGWRNLVVAGLVLSATAGTAAAESRSAGPSAQVAAPIVAAADSETPKRDAERTVLSPDNAAGVDVEPLTVLFAGLGVGVLLLLRRLGR